MELSAQFGLEVGGYVDLLLEFIPAVGVGALVSELALAVLLEIPAQLCFFLDLVLKFEMLSLFCSLELSLLAASSGFAIMVRGSIRDSIRGQSLKPFTWGTLLESHLLVSLLLGIGLSSRLSSELLVWKWLV